jgi:HEPN domain-containing protein
MGVRATQTVEGLDDALREFRAARRSAAEGKYAVACMAARLSAADALEALLSARGREARGATLSDLLRETGDLYDVSQIARAAAELDSCSDYREDLGPSEFAAARALARAEQVILWVRERLPGPRQPGRARRLGPRAPTP